MGRIYKRKDVWYINVRMKGRRIRRRVDRSKRIAELALRDAEVKIARDEFGFTLLHDLKQKSNTTSDTDYVLNVKSYGRSHNWLRTELIRIAEKAGISNLTKVHTLHHTFASHLVMQGIDLPTVAKLMGHSDIETTMIYAHLAPDYLADAVDKLELE